MQTIIKIYGHKKSNLSEDFYYVVFQKNDLSMEQIMISYKPETSVMVSWENPQNFKLVKSTNQDVTNTLSPALYKRIEEFVNELEFENLI